MKRLILLLVAIAGCLSAEQGFVAPVTLPDITGDSSAHQIASSGSARWIQIIVGSSNAASVRVGDSTTSSTRGLPLPAGSGLFLPPLPPLSPGQPVLGLQLYDLSKLYYYATTSDKVYILWGN